MIITTRPEEVSKKIIELCEQEKIESRHVHMSRIEFLSGSKKQQMYTELIKNIHTFSNIIFTSQASAKFGSDLFNLHPGLLNSKQNIFSVGDATKKILIDNGFKSITPSNKSSQGIIDLIKEKSANYKIEKQDKLRLKIESLLNGEGIDESRLIQEVAYYSEKMDVTEEIVRCEIHFSQLNSYLETNEPVGKRINFLLQEITREINTIGSKSSQTEVIINIVEIKNELEKIREQFQNIL